MLVRQNYRKRSPSNKVATPHSHSPPLPSPLDEMYSDQCSPSSTTDKINNNNNNINNNNNNNNNKDEKSSSSVDVPSPASPATTKGRFIGTHFLAARDEEILSSNGIEITAHLGEGYFGHVWRGRETKGMSRQEQLNAIQCSTDSLSDLSLSKQKGD